DVIVRARVKQDSPWDVNQGDSPSGRGMFHTRYLTYVRNDINNVHFSMNRTTPQRHCFRRIMFGCKVELRGS
ncbi:MAG: hypothetical protein AB7H80_15555, partial [Candidatus Kapaibacterium sp.]